MTENRVLLDTAAFMDSPQATAITAVDTKQVREIVQRVIAACLDDIAKIPRLLEGEDMALLLREILPRHFGTRDPLAPAVEEVLRAFLAYLQETEIVPAAFELRCAVDEHASSFVAAVKSGVAHRDGIAVTRRQKPIVHRGTKVGRNDPCPCGSGKKFKKCCMNLGS